MRFFRYCIKKIRPRKLFASKVSSFCLRHEFFKKSFCPLTAALLPLGSQEFYQGVFHCFTVYIVFLFYNFINSNLFCQYFCTQIVLTHFYNIFHLRNICILALKNRIKSRLKPLGIDEVI